MEGSSLPLARGSEYPGQGNLKWWGLSFVSGVHEIAENHQTRRQALAIRKLQAPGQCCVLAEWLALQRYFGSDSCPRALHKKCAVCQKRCYRTAPFSLVREPLSSLWHWFYTEVAPPATSAFTRYLRAEADPFSYLGRKPDFSSSLGRALQGKDGSFLPVCSLVLSVQRSLL